MSRFCVTFGGGQLGGFGSHYFIVIEAPDEMVACRLMNDQWAGKWSMIYPAEGFGQQVLEYNYKCLGIYICYDEHSWDVQRGEDYVPSL